MGNYITSPFPPNAIRTRLFVAVIRPAGDEMGKRGCGARRENNPLSHQLLPRLGLRISLEVRHGLGADQKLITLWSEVEPPPSLPSRDARHPGVPGRGE